MKNHFFPWQATPTTFLLYTLVLVVILHADFGLIWTTPWPDEKDPFLKILFREIQKVPYEILTFFLGKIYQKFFLIYTLITLVIQHTKLGLILTTLWPDEKELLLKFGRIRISRNSQNSVWKTNFFSRQAIPKVFLPNTFLTLVILHHADFGLSWTTPWPDEKNPFLKFFFREIQKFVWKTNSFPRQDITKIVLF